MNQNITSLSLSFFLIISLSYFSCSHAQEKWGNEINYGKYSVGYKTIHVKDYSRTYKMSSNSSFSPRPMQIGVWYPTSITKKKYLKLEHFLFLENTEETLEELNVKNLVLPPRYNNIKIPDELLKTNTHSIHNAKQAKGEFPLLIYGTSQSSSGFDNIVLCEVLASHGFIVVTVASKNEFNRRMPFTVRGMEAQARDMEFLYGLMYNHKGVDNSRVGTFGFSFGGLSMVPFSIRNKNVKAMVALDASITNGYYILESIPSLKMGDFNSNFLAFMASKDNINQYPLYNASFLSDINLIEVKDLIHTDFSSTNLILNDSPAFKFKYYASIANLTTSFFKSQLYGNADFEKKFKNESKPIYGAKRVKKKLGKPRVSSEEYVNYIKENGIDKGIMIYEETKLNFPNYQLFDYTTFRDIGYLFMLRKKYAEAVKTFEVLMKEFPENDDSYRRLGEAKMMLGDYKEARKILEDGLVLNPESPALKDILKRLAKKE